MMKQKSVPYTKLYPVNLDNEDDSVMGIDALPESEVNTNAPSNVVDEPSESLIGISEDSIYSGFQIKEQHVIYTAIFTVFSIILENNNFNEDDAIEFVNAMVIPDNHFIEESRSDKIMALFHKNRERNKSIYQLFLQQKYLSSFKKHDKKIKVMDALVANLLPVSQGDGAGVTLLHSLTKKIF